VNKGREAARELHRPEGLCKTLLLGEREAGGR
jgi:hypothetical protein